MNRDDLQDAELRAIAQGLGARAAERLDVEAAAQAVLERLRQTPRTVHWTRRRPVWLSLAAAAVLLLGTSAVLRNVRHHARPVPGIGGPAGVDLNDLSPDQLREVLSTFDQSWDDAASSADTEWEDLSAPELRSLLRSLEG